MVIPENKKISGVTIKKSLGVRGINKQVNNAGAYQQAVVNKRQAFNKNISAACVPKFMN